MGNWRTVRIIGTCNADEVAPLREELMSYERIRRLPVSQWGDFHCGPLTISNGIMGLGDWTGERIDAHGNLFERDYSVEEVAWQLTELAKVAPSLAVKVHCGGDYEDTRCVATITLQDGAATIGEPEVKDVGDLVGDGDFSERVMRALLNAD